MGKKNIRPTHSHLRCQRISPSQSLMAKSVAGLPGTSVVARYFTVFAAGSKVPLGRLIECWVVAAIHHFHGKYAAEAVPRLPNHDVWRIRACPFRGDHPRIARINPKGCGEIAVLYGDRNIKHRVDRPYPSACPEAAVGVNLYFNVRHIAIHAAGYSCN